MKTLKFVVLSMVVLLAAACGPANATTPTPEPQATQAPEAIGRAQAWLATHLNLPAASITLVNAERREWSDSCLGLGQAHESCALVITPGWLLTFSAHGKQVEVRTDENGDSVRVAPAAEGPLAGTSWRLVAYGQAGAETRALTGSNVTLEFSSADQAVGSAGCNSYGSAYQAAGASISFSEVISTQMACADDNLMTQETQFLEALQVAQEFELSGATLVLRYDEGQGTLTFERTSD